MTAALAAFVLVGTMAALRAQQSAAFPFQGFELGKLREVYTYGRDKPETSTAEAYFTPSRAGRRCRRALCWNSVWRGLR
jgi:hypothetical protein